MRMGMGRRLRRLVGIIAWAEECKIEAGKVFQREERRCLSSWLSDGREIAASILCEKGIERSIEEL